MIAAEPTAVGLADRITAIVGIDAEAPAIEFDSAWITWGALADASAAVAAAIPTPGTEVGVITRNRPATVAAILGVLRARACVVMINPTRGDGRARDDLEALDLPIVIGSAQDLDLVSDRARATRVLMPELDPEPEPGTSVEVQPGPNPDPGEGRPGVAVRMLTSGTTGPPKRIDIGYSTFEKVLAGAKHYESSADQPLQLRSGIAIVNAPLAHVGGLFRVLQCVVDGRSFALLERFSVDGWLAAVRRHRPRTSSLVPTALRMVLDADIDPADLSSLKSVVSGTAPLDPDDADAFFRKYGIPVLIAYGATEFAGGVAGWNIADHREFWDTKKGSVGRAHPGCSLRVVDPDTGATIGPDGIGLLEVQASQLGGRDWVRTTDLARIDSDGFLWILGRSDQAIIRGGFKIIPDDVRTALERHPSVRGAVVLGRSDRRLGAVPIAGVELRPDAKPVTGEDLRAYIGEHLAPYEVPAEIRVVPALPRTESGKVDLCAAGAMLDADLGEG